MYKILRSSLRILPAVIGICVLPLNTLASASFSVVHCFGGTSLGANPYGEMVVGNDGCLYGTTSAGGTTGGWGTLFKLTTNGSFTSLYSFTDQNDGGNPMGGLLPAGGGNFYGTTMAGGSTGQGTVFKWNANGGLTTLGTFQGGEGGANPESALVQGGAGYLYGTTMATAVVHESYVMGTVFNISPGGGSPQAFDVFQWPDFAKPNGLVIGSDGKYYFTTRGGPAFGGFPYNGYYGAIGDTAGDVIYLFSGGNDGAYPHAALVQGSDDFFYGTTHDGGTNGFGVVFKVNSSGLFTNLYSFTNGIDGANPEAKLAQGTDGNFYGTTFAGGAYGFGTVFVIGPSGGLTNLHFFTGQSDGGNPYAGLVQAGDGNFYGSTYTNNQGGGSGTLFRITPTGTFTTLVSFGLPTDGQLPQGALTVAADGSLYGMATTGGTNGAGTIYRLSPDGTCSALYSFTGGNDGGSPFGRLAWGNDGNLYGTTRSGGSNNFGTVFKITPAGVFTSLYSFTNGSDGTPGYFGLTLDGSFGLTLGTDATFYGATCTGGTGGAGTLYNITTNGVFTLLHSFNGSDGQRAECALTLGSDGWFYGTTDSGGPNNAGTIFKIRPDGLFSNLYSFTGQADGNFPSPVLMQGADGNFYGVCTFGGSNGVGNVFQITSNGVLTVIHHFTSGSDGDYPIGGLAFGADGNFYGIASDCDGTPRYGTTFQITPGGVLTPLTAFTYDDTIKNENLKTPLAEGRDGDFYGVSPFGGAGYGFLYRVSCALASPIVAFTATPACGQAPLSVQFNAPTLDSASNAIVSWNWNFGDGNTSTNQTSPVHTYTNAGICYPALDATNSLGQTVLGIGPPSIVVTNPVVVYTITGWVAGNTLTNEVTLWMGLTQVTTTNHGQYQFTVSTNGVCIITPVNTNYLFIPASVQVSVGPSQTNLNFQACLWNTLTLADCTGQVLHLILASHNTGLTYQTLASSDLVTWTPIATNTVGASHYFDVYVPLTNAPHQFFCTVKP